MSYSPETLQAFIQRCKVSVAGTLLLFVVQQINIFLILELLGQASGLI